MSKKRPEKTSGETGPLNAGENACTPETALSPSVSQTATVEPASVIAEQVAQPEPEPAKDDAPLLAHPESVAEPDEVISGKRHFPALAAAVALATFAGALGGAVATAGISHLAGKNIATAGSHTLDEAVARIDADLASLKVSLEQRSGKNEGEFTKIRERLDRFEKALAEPGSKIAQLSEAVERLRTMPAAAASVTAAAAPGKESTGSIAQPAEVPGVPAPKPELRRLPTVEGWVLRYVTNGGALIEGRQGMYEVYAGDPVPGLGRVDAIRRQDGRWVVVTSKGLIVAR